MKEYERIAKDMISTNPPQEFLEFLKEVDDLAGFAGGGVRSRQIVALAWFLWSQLRNREDVLDEG